MHPLIFQRHPNLIELLLMKPQLDGLRLQTLQLLKRIRLHLEQGFREVGRLSEVAYKFDRWLDLVFLQLTL